MSPRRLTVFLLVFAGAVFSADELADGDAYTWRGLTLFAPSAYWEVVELPDGLTLLRVEETGEVAGSLFLEAPDAGLAEAAADGERGAVQEELVRLLAQSCRESYGQAFDIVRLDADGKEAAAGLHFTADERRVRAYAFLAREGVYLLFLECEPEVEERLAAELDRLVGTVSLH